MRFAKLIMITENNNNKEYIMTQIDDSTFKAEWGRVGSSYQSTTYPIYEWCSKYNSKVKKGYKDVSNLVEKVDVSGDSLTLPFNYITNKSIKDILNRLYKYTDSYLKANYLVNTTDVSQTQIDKAYKIIDELEKLFKNEKVSCSGNTDSLL